MDFVTDCREVVEEIPEWVAASWKEHYEYLESALSPFGIIIYKSGTVGLIIDGIQRVREDNLEAFTRALDAFTLGVKIARGEARDSDCL